MHMPEDGGAGPDQAAEEVSLESVGMNQVRRQPADLPAQPRDVVPGRRRRRQGASEEGRQFAQAGSVQLAVAQRRHRGGHGNQAHAPPRRLPRAVPVVLRPAAAGAVRRMGPPHAPTTKPISKTRSAPPRQLVGLR